MTETQAHILWSALTAIWPGFRKFSELEKRKIISLMLPEDLAEMNAAIDRAAKTLPPHFLPSFPELYEPIRLRKEAEERESAAQQAQDKQTTELEWLKEQARRNCLEVYELGGRVYTRAPKFARKRLTSLEVM